jgi:hypothetical protein
MRNCGSLPAHLSSSSDSHVAVEHAIAMLFLDSHAAVERAIATVAAAMKKAIDLAFKKAFPAFAASLAAMLVELVAAGEADKQLCHEMATRKKELADDAKMQRCQELAERAAALAESVLAAEQSC